MKERYPRAYTNILVMFSLLFAINSMPANTSDTGSANDSILPVIKKTTATLSAGGIGGWIGTGVGYNLTVELAKILNDSEPDAGIIARATSKARVNDFVEDWGKTGKVIGGAVGFGICGYCVSEWYENYNAHLLSWKKFFSGLYNINLRNLDLGDVKNLGKDTMAILFVIFVMRDLSKK